MDLISRKSLLEKTHMANMRNAYENKVETVEIVLADDVEVAPSAFEGMTNGEVIQALFPNMKVHEYTEKVVLQGIGQDFQVWGDAWYVWWDSPYKGVSE